MDLTSPLAPVGAFSAVPQLAPHPLELTAVPPYSTIWPRWCELVVVAIGRVLLLSILPVKTVSRAFSNRLAFSSQL